MFKIRTTLVSGFMQFTILMLATEFELHYSMKFTAPDLIRSFICKHFGLYILEYMGMGKFTILLFIVIGLNITITAQQPDFQKGLLAFYPFNGTTTDASGNGHHGTAHGVSSTINRFDDPNSASAFNGADNLLSFSGMQLQSSNITICGWLMVTDKNADTVFKYITPANNTFMLRVVNHNYQVEIHLSGTKIVFPNYSGMYEIDPMHPRFDFLFLSFIDNRLTFSINNNSMGQSLDDQLIQTTFPYTIKNNPVVTINGVLDEMRIYNRALSNEERTILYFAQPRFTSFSISKITQTSVNVESTLKTLGGAEIIERGIKWDIKPDIDSLSHKLIVSTDTGRIVTNITGLAPYTTYYLRSYVITSSEIYEDQLTLKFTTFRDLSDATLTDVDGNRYHTVKIGTQTWMAENLKTTKYADGTPIGNGTIDNEEYGKYYFIYNNDSSSIDAHGLYYTWMAAANSDYGKTFPNGIQGACPDGWHLPNFAEQKALINYLGGSAVAGGKLKETGIAHWNAPNTGATNASGFAALGSGVRRNNYSSGEFSYTGDYTAFWGSESTYSETFEGKFYRSTVLSLSNESESAGVGMQLSTWACPVRCIKDTSLSYVEIPEIITLPVTDISGTTVTTGGKLIKDGGAIKFNSQGICWSTNPHPDTSDFKTIDNKDFNYKNQRTFSNTLTGLEPNTKYYARAYVSNSAGVGYGNELSFITTPDSLRGTITDIEGNVYKTITINHQVWMSENLRTTHFNDGNPIQLITNYDYWSIAGGGSSPDLNAGSAAMGWYQNDSINYTYGALYNWKAVDSKKLCPSGWHVPTLYEWTELENYLGGAEIAGGKMKATSTDFWSSPNTGATNESGFSALPGGFRQGLNGDSRLGYIAKIWTSTAGYLMNLENTSSILTNTRVNNKYGSSVRCINDSSEKTFPVISADSVYSIGAHTATIKSSIKRSGGSDIIETGICWSTSPFPDTSDFKTSEQTISSIFTSNLTQLTPFTTYYVRTYAINRNRIGYSNELTFTTKPDLPTTKDIDGNTYYIVQIGNQKWLTENLKTTHLNDGTPIIFDENQWANDSTPLYAWYNNDENKYKNQYGALYNWNTINTDKLCPTGWHVPNSVDWINLADNLGGLTLAGGKMKEIGTKHWFTPNLGATNESGFNAIPTSWRDPFQVPYPIGSSAMWWCSNAFSTDRAYLTALQNDGTDLSVYHLYKYFGLSVRCVQHFESTPSIITNKAINITDNSALVVSIRCNDIDSTISDFGICWSSSPHPDTSSNKLSGGVENTKIKSNITGLLPNTLYYVRAYAINAIGISYGNEIVFKTMGGTLTDIEGNIYKKVKIGTQTWMAENLKTTKYNDGTPISIITDDNIWNNLTSGAYCWHDNNIENKNDYGATYNWYAVNTSKLCPAGWHVPDESEWDILTEYLGGETIAGGKMLEFGSHWQTGVDIKNNTGFTGLIGGYRLGGFACCGASWWSASQENNLNAWNRSLGTDNTYIFKYSNNKSTGFSIRCLEDFDAPLENNSVIGDIDSNHQIQSTDASLALQYSVGLDPLPSVDPLPWEETRIATADVDNQNGITAYDASLILQYEAGLITSFPAEDTNKSFLSPQADIDVSLENGFVTIRPVGELYGFNLNITGNTESFGSPEILDRKFISAVNVTPGNYSVGLASANAPKGNDVIIKIPVNALPTQQVTVDLLINNKARQYVLGLPTNAPETSQKAVEFYPNPANTIVYFRNLSKDALVTIYDLRGKVLIKTKVMDSWIDISSLADGVYFIHIRNDANTIIRKLMKE